MVRLSDARMSGTSYGACILPFRRNPISAGRGAGQNGDQITLGCRGATINLDVRKLTGKRRAEWKQPKPLRTRLW